MRDLHSSYDVGAIGIVSVGEGSYSLYCVGRVIISIVCSMSQSGRLT